MVVVDERAQAFSLGCPDGQHRAEGVGYSPCEAARHGVTAGDGGERCGHCAGDSEQPAFSEDRGRDTCVCEGCEASAQRRSRRRGPPGAQGVTEWTGRRTEITGIGEEERVGCISGLAAPMPLLFIPTGFADAYGLIGSSVGIFSDDARALSALRVFSSPRGRACAAQQLAESITIEGGPDRQRVDSVALKTTFVDRERLLGRGAVGVHVLDEFPRGEGTAPLVFHAEADVFRVGRAEIWLISIDFKRQLPARVEVQLLALLRRRAETHHP